MESWCFVKHKVTVLIFTMLLIFKVGWALGIHIEDERKALLEMKASLHEISNFFNVDNLLPTWVDHKTAAGKYCDWERIKCDTTSGFVTELSMGNMFSIDDDDYFDNFLNMRGNWPLNASLFLHFKELRSLDLSMNFIGNMFPSTGLERLSGLKKLENLNLSLNFIETDVFPSLSGLTSLKILDLAYINIENWQEPTPPLTHDISEYRISKNLEVLNLTGGGYYGTFQMQGLESASTLRKLKILNLRWNNFNESLVTSLSALPSLTILDLSDNLLSGPFPSQELSLLINLEKLDLSGNQLNVTPNIQACKTLMRLERLNSVSLAGNNFNKSIISCLSFLPSLNTLDLTWSSYLESSFPMQELSSLRELKTLNMSYCGLQSLPLNGIMSNLQHLTLNYNNFSLVDDIMSFMAAFPSLRFLSLVNCYMEGRLFANEVPYLPYLEVLILRRNYLNGTLPIEGRLPEFKAQFGTFTKESYKGNPLLCGQPLENNCTTTPQVRESSTMEDKEKWYDIDMTSFYGSSCSTWFVFMLGFVAVLYINPCWRRRWLEFVEECMYTCYYFLYDFVRNLYKVFHE